MFVNGIRNPMVRRDVDTAWAALVQLPDEIGILRKIMQRLLLCPYDFQHQGMMEYRDRTMRAINDITGRFFVHPWGVNPSFSSMGRHDGALVDRHETAEISHVNYSWCKNIAASPFLLSWHIVVVDEDRKEYTKPPAAGPSVNVQDITELGLTRRELIDWQRKAQQYQIMAMMMRREKVGMQLDLTKKVSML
jgi:hypothetical protein